MAAVDAVFHLFSPGDHIILGDDLYGGSIRMFTNIYEKNGIEFTYVGTSDLDAVKAAFKPNTKAVYIETPTNPMMEITDIRALCALVHERNALVIIDNTFLSPYFQKPLTLVQILSFIVVQNSSVSSSRCYFWFYYCERRGEFVCKRNCALNKTLFPGSRNPGYV